MQIPIGPNNLSERALASAKRFLALCEEVPLSERFLVASDPSRREVIIMDQVTGRVTTVHINLYRMARRLLNDLYGSERTGEIDPEGMSGLPVTPKR